MRKFASILLAANAVASVPAVCAAAEAPATYVRDFQIDSEFHIDGEAVGEDLARFKGRKLTLREINDAVKAVQDFCYRDGYIGSAAYLPPQESKNGVIRIGVSTFRFGKVTIDNKSHMKTAMLEKLASSIKEGEIVRGQSLEDALYRMNDLGGIRATGSMDKNKDGKIDVVIHVEDFETTRNILYTDNYGNDGTGKYQTGWQFTKYDVDNEGALAQASVLKSNKNLWNAGAKYQFVADPWTFATAGAEIGRTNYSLHGDMDSVGNKGKYTDASVFYDVPIRKTVNEGLSLGAKLKYKEMTSDLDLFNVSLDRHSYAATGTVAGYQRTHTGIFNWDATLTAGKLANDSDFSKAMDEYNHTSGHYTTLLTTGSFKNRMDKQLDFQMKWQMQFASSPLDSSEKLSLGGPNGVRAYDAGDSSGDYGYLVSAELRYNTKIPGLTLKAFYDAGETRDKLSTDGDVLRGWGVGADYVHPQDCFVSLDYARKVGFEHDATDDTGKGRVWFVAGKMF